MPHSKHKQLLELTPKQLRNLWRKIDRRAEDECWPWSRSIRGGYGTVKLYQKVFLVPRVVFFVTTGIDPGEFSVCHSCDNPACCNPNHLSLGTHRENMKERNERSPKWAQRNRRLIGATHPRAKFTAEQVAAMRAAYARGEGNQHELARKFGMSLAQGSKILTGKSWAS